MTTASSGTIATGAQTETAAPAFSPYDRWIESLGVPIYREYFLDDLRTIKLGRWEARECDAGFLQLAGQQGVSGAYVTEIPPGKTLPPFRMAMDEEIYVLQGRGLTTIRDRDGSSKSFEWQSHSLFLVPGNHSYQLSNTQGTQPARLLHHNYLPLAMSVIPSPDYFLNNPTVESSLAHGAENGDFYSEAKAVRRTDALMGERNVWVGNFFPDMRAWDRLDPLRFRGAGGLSVNIEYPGSPLTAHMSVFPPLTYKKAHRHGPGFVIVIPAGEGYSIIWPAAGAEKVIIPWHEGTCFVPPMRWWHQHFNVGQSADRYLALHPPRGLSRSGERIEDAARDQIEYPDEESFIRQKFEEELGKRGQKSLMPEEAYRDRNYAWTDLKA